MGPKGCPEMLVRICHYTLRNIPEERRFHLLRGRGTKFRGRVSVFLLPLQPPFLSFAVAHGRQ